MTGASTNTVVIIYTDRIGETEVLSTDVWLKRVTEFSDQVLKTLVQAYHDLVFQIRTFFDRVTGIDTTVNSVLVSEEVRVSVRPHTVTMSLSPGYNVVCLPVVNDSFTASSFLEYIGDPAESVSMFDVTSQGYVSYDKNLAEFGVPQTDFKIKLNEGYFIYSGGSANFVVIGASGSGRDIPLRQGYNLVGWTTIVKSTVTTAFIYPSGGLVDAVFMFDEASQQYVSYDRKLAEFGVPQPDFQILPGEGYFVFANANCVLHYDE